MCQYVYKYSNEYIFSCLDIVIIELFRKTIIPDKKRYFQIPRVRLIDNSSNIYLSIQNELDTA